MTNVIPDAGHMTRRVPALLGEMARQPQLVAASVGTIAAGLVTRRPELIRGGTRMLAVHLLTSAARVAMRQRADQAPVAAAAPPPSPVSEAIVAGVVGWVAEAAIDATLKRIVPDRKPADAPE